MRVLMIGGTGLISTGIVKHLLVRGAEITVFTSASENARFHRACSSCTVIGTMRPH
jgi:uncharacterized protein YbjT (DUF2867 family)